MTLLKKGRVRKRHVEGGVLGAVFGSMPTLVWTVEFGDERSLYGAFAFWQAAQEFAHNIGCAGQTLQVNQARADLEALERKIR